MYGYPSEHYEFWRKELPAADLPWGSFGENFTTEGLTESRSPHRRSPPDRHAISWFASRAYPAYKLAAKFEREDIVARFQIAAAAGFTFRWSAKGRSTGGDLFELLSREPHAIRIAEMNRLFVEDRYNRALLEKAIATPALPEDWREFLSKRLSAFQASQS